MKTRKITKTIKTNITKRNLKLTKAIFGIKSNRKRIIPYNITITIW